MVDSPGDAVDEAPGAGKTDKVTLSSQQPRLAQYALPPNVEDLDGSSGSETLVGNERERRGRSGRLRAGSADGTCCRRRRIQCWALLLRVVEYIAPGIPVVMLCRSLIQDKTAYISTSRRRLRCAAAPCTVSNKIRGGNGQDTISGGDGNDDLDGGFGEWRLLVVLGTFCHLPPPQTARDTQCRARRLPPGNDKVFGNAGNDELDGGPGEDQVGWRRREDRAGSSNTSVYGNAPTCHHLQSNPTRPASAYALHHA